MKNKWFTIILIAIIGCIALSCDNGTTTGGGTATLNGLWLLNTLGYGGFEIFIFNNGSFEEQNFRKGTYTVSGNRITVLDTHYWDNGQWVKDEDEYTWSAIYSISGNTLTLTFTDSDGSNTEIKTYTKYSGSGTSGDFSYVIGDVAAITGYNGNGGAVTIPAQINGKPVTSVGIFAFDGFDSITSVTIPDRVTSMEFAFLYCESLTAINVGTGNTAYSSQDGVLYNKNKTTLVTYPAGKTATSFSIPNSVTSIGECAFSSCTSLASVNIPNSVTSIGDNAFDFCASLASVTVDNSNPNYSSVDGILYNKVKTEFVLIPAKLTGNVTIPDSVTSIGQRAFTHCASLTSITIPDSVTSIGERAFAGCTSLTSVTIGNNVTSIGERAFAGQWGIPMNLTSVTIGNSVTNIGDEAFCYCASLTSITIPDSVTSIGNYAFSYCTSLASVTIGNSVTSIGDAAFEGCASLASVTIGNSVTSIGERAFNSTSLTSVTISISVTSIGEYAFIGTNLTSVTFAIGSNIANASFGGNAFPEGNDGNGDTLKTAYATGKAGTYTRPANGSTWTKQ
ncbi:hypothetical protein R84B8_03151 [Treponema sp. R8-4-B8]